MATTMVMATDRQRAYIATLAAERAVSLPAGWLDGIDRLGASRSIEKLLTLPRRAPAPTTAPNSTVPAGRYALDRDGAIRFYRVDRPEEGRWAGYTFVRVQAGDNSWAIRGDEKAAVLAAIAADPQAASARYGQELGACGVCGRTLTDAESRTRGIGPVCAERMGW